MLQKIRDETVEYEKDQDEYPGDHKEDGVDNRDNAPINIAAAQLEAEDLIDADDEFVNAVGAEPDGGNNTESDGACRCAGSQHAYRGMDERLRLVGQQGNRSVEGAHGICKKKRADLNECQH